MGRMDGYTRSACRPAITCDGRPEAPETTQPRMAPPPAQPRPLDTLWQARTILWIVLAGEALAAIVALAPGFTGDRLAYFGLASFAIQWIFLMALGGLYLIRRRLAGASPPVVAQIGLASLLLSTWLVCWLGWLSLHDLWPMPAGSWGMFALQLTGISLTVGLLALAAFQAQWRTRQLALRAKQADLDALRARIRPHFLFNTLNTGIALVHARPDATEQLLLDLSDLFRAAISNQESIPLKDELALARRYLDIEQLRFGQRLSVLWQVPCDEDDIPMVALPPLSIQPLVENAIKHGIEPSVEGGFVSLDVHVCAGTATIVVRNTLSTKGASAGHGIGLNAVTGRIEAFTQGAGGLRTRTENGQYVAELWIPLR